VQVDLLGREGYEPSQCPTPTASTGPRLTALPRRGCRHQPRQVQTHTQTTLTLALKNTFGCRAAGPPARARDGTYDAVAEALADCYAACVPQLNLVDAVVAMEASARPKRHGSRFMGVSTSR